MAVAGNENAVQLLEKAKNDRSAYVRRTVKRSLKAVWLAERERTASVEISEVFATQQTYEDLYQISQNYLQISQNYFLRIIFKKIIPSDFDICASGRSHERDACCRERDDRGGKGG